MQRSEILRENLVQRLARFGSSRFAARSAAVVGPSSLRAAAVALTVVDEGTGADLEGIPVPPGWSTKAALVLTRRAVGLRRHSGQWALPGGRVDPGETPTQAALRELAEEIGLHVDNGAVLGRLDEVVTRSGFLITPLVVWAGPGKKLAPNPAEVASVHRIPLSELMRIDAPILQEEVGQSVPVLYMPVGSTSIAAPTAAILYQFREVCLLGRHTRVDHYGQPRFTWT